MNLRFLFLLGVVFLVFTACKKELDPPIPDFFINHTDCLAQCPVHFTNNSKNATSFLWDFGDGTTSAEASPTHVYASQGKYSVQLTAMGQGGSARQTKEFVIAGSNKNDLLSFSFLKSKNPILSTDLIGQIVDSKVTVSVPEGMSRDLVASFTISERAKAFVGTVEQVSGSTSSDFASATTYRIVSEGGQEKEYKIELIEKDLKPPHYVKFLWSNDSVTLLFDEKVKLVSIESTSPIFQFSVSETGVTYVKEGNGIKFRCGYCRLGGDHPFRYRVKDLAGNLSDSTLTLSFYLRKISIGAQNGRISRFIVDDDAKMCYVLSIEPYVLTLISLTTYDIIDQIKLDFIKPSLLGPDVYPNLAINPYNHLFYFTSTRNQFIYVYDLATRTLVKTIEILPDALDHPQYPMNYAFQFAFSKNGIGAIVCGNTSGVGRVRLIDTAHNDEISDLSGYSNGCIGMSTDVDNTKIILGSADLGGRFDIYDTDTKQVTAITYDKDFPSAPIGGLNYFCKSKASDRIFVSQIYAQFITDLNGAVGNYSFIDSRSFEWGADFSYRRGETDIVYFYIDRGDPTLSIVDYGKFVMLKQFYAVSGVTGLTNTTDDSLMIFFESFYKKSIYLIDIKMLRGEN